MDFNDVMNEMNRWIDDGKIEQQEEEGTYADEYVHGVLNDEYSNDEQNVLDEQEDQGDEADGNDVIAGDGERD